MKKSEMKALVRAAVDSKDLCRMYFKYDKNYFYYFPLIVGDKLFLGVEEDDFILDGFSVRRFSDLTKVQIRDDKCVEIIKAEGLIDGLTVPEVDMTDWHSVFLSLQKMNRNIIIERESLECDECIYVIGRIEKVLKNKVLFRDFDSDGVWLDALCEIPFSQITSVTFGSRYVDVFSKYI